MGSELGRIRDEVIDALRASRAAAQVYDDDGRLAWVSDQMLELAGAGSDVEVGVGMRLDEGIELPLWTSMLSPAARTALRDELGRRLDPDPGLAPLWVSSVEIGIGGRTRETGMLGVTVRAPDGGLVGTALVFAPLLPARVLALVSEGDEAMFTRMADLSEPGRRPTAVLFADIDSSGPLSRRLPTPVYFDLVRRFTTTFDELVAQHGGIVGKHAGDGASAYFLAVDGARESATARAALAVALALPGATREVVDAIDAEGVSGDDCRVNLGVHWGANLYIGQIVTGGRLEVTALGDEVTECARIEQVATEGQTLASKTLVERLDDDDARALGLDPMGLVYTVLAELAGQSPKAVRDAGALAVVDLTGTLPA